MRHEHRRRGRRESKRESLRWACLLTLAVRGARGQGCQDDPTGLIASYGLDCATISQAYPCTWDMQAAGWLVPPHTTVTDETALASLSTAAISAFAPKTPARTLAPCRTSATLWSPAQKSKREHNVSKQ